MDAESLKRGMGGLAVAMMADAAEKHAGLLTEIRTRMAAARRSDIDISQVAAKVWSVRHRYVVGGFGFFSPAALMLDEFSKDEALTDLDRLALHHWAAGILIRSTLTHAARGNGILAGARLAECFDVLKSADSLIFPSFAERQARATAIKADRTRDASVKARKKHAPTTAAKDAIRAAWAGGKYSTRALCAEQEAAALGISFDTARKALRNTPDPA